MVQVFQIYLLCPIFSVVLYPILGNEIFEKFHQNTYKYKDFRAELESYSEDTLHFVELKTFKFNRSVAAVNASLMTKINIDGEKLDVLVQVYKFTSTEYRIFPIRYRANALSGLNLNVMGIKDAFKCGNFPLEDLNFKKDVKYHVCNGVPDVTHFPPLIPSGRYMAQYTAIYEEQDVVVINCFAEIYIPM